MFKFFENLVNPFQDTVGRPSSGGTFDFIRSQSQGMKKYMLLVAIFSTCTAATEVYIFKFIGDLVDALDPSGSFWLDNSSVLLQIVFVFLFILPLAAFAHTLFWHQTLEGNFPLKILSSGHQYLLKQDITFYQKEAAGKIANTLLQTSVSAKMVVLKLIDTFMFATVFSTSMLFLLVGFNWQLLFPVLFWFIGYVLVIFYFVPKLKFWSKTQAGARSAMVGQLVDTYTNIATVKLFSHSNIEKNYAHRYMGQYLKTVQGQMRFISKVQFFMWGLNIMLIFGTIVLSLFLWKGNLISIGAIAAAVGVSFRVYTLSHWIMWEISAFFSNLGIVQDGLKLLSVPLPKAALEKGDVLNVEKHDIYFKGVSFSYKNSGQIVNNFTLHIAPGEKIGIIGRSGSGKSTLIKLLMRFHELDEGEITIGGKDIRAIDHEALLANIAVIAQDVELLDRTVRENLAYGKSEVTEDEIISAAKAAGAHNFIINLVDDYGGKGYDARVGVRGAMLSGGERQRISLARAFIKDAPIVVFDEATSALDSEVEFQIMKSSQKYLEGKTVIMIAHRLTSLSRIDRLAVIEGGKLIELGNHEELKLKEGVYSQILSLQSEKMFDMQKESVCP